MKRIASKMVKVFAAYAVVAAMLLGFAVNGAFATNGMNLEGYGPIATGMGGASMAYDNGSAAVMNNPATLGLMPEGNRLDVALGYLGPHVTTKMPGMDDADSSARAFYMPAFGWIQKSGQYSYGFGVFAQGGMGTEYDKRSFLAAGSEETVRSEVSMGRAIVPFAYEVNPNLSLAASLDFVWAGMDVKMALDGNQFLDMAGGTQALGTVSGSMMTAFNGSVGAGVIASGQGGAPAPVNWGRFDFSNNNDFTGEATGTGLAGKLGGVYKVNEKLSLGAAYHSKTALDDLETSSAKVSFNANVDDNVLNQSWNPQTGEGAGPAGTYQAVTIPVTGKIEVKDFEWPQMLAFGAAYKATDKLMLVADYKWINWKDAMKDFKMTFTADSAAAQAGLAQGFGDTVLDATLFQNWKDQHVFMLGAAYRLNDPLTLRGGLNLAGNPIPDEYMNPLFPAIIKNHIMIGAGYAVSQTSSVDASFTYAPEVKAGQGVESTHSQTNSQVMYSYRF